MLVLGLEPNQQVKIGDDLVITIVRAGSGKCRIGFECPKDIPIVRENAKNKEPRGENRE